MILLLINKVRCILIQRIHYFFRSLNEQSMKKISKVIYIFFHYSSFVGVIC